MVVRNIIPTSPNRIFIYSLKIEKMHTSRSRILLMRRGSLQKLLCSKNTPINPADSPARRSETNVLNGNILRLVTRPHHPCLCDFQLLLRTDQQSSTEERLKKGGGVCNRSRWPVEIEKSNVSLVLNSHGRKREWRSRCFQIEIKKLPGEISVLSAIIDHGHVRPAAERTVLGIVVNIQRCRDRGRLPLRYVIWNHYRRRDMAMSHHIVRLLSKLAFWFRNNHTGDGGLLIKGVWEASRCWEVRSTPPWIGVVVTINCSAVVVNISTSNRGWW